MKMKKLLLILLVTYFLVAAYGKARSCYDGYKSSDNFIAGKL